MRSLRWLIVPLVVLPIGWLLLSGFGRDPREVATPLIGQAAPRWTLATLDGSVLSTDALAGRPYVVNFWASWCIPECINEHPVLAAIHERLGTEVAIVGVLYQDAPASAEAFLARHGDAGYEHVLDEDGRLAIDFGVTGPPESYFVDANGVVRAKQFGPLTDALMARHLTAIGIGG
jgi:cytochrome c biogenesis protein CcmG/thiol:disulfide interchange protein DsbE